MTDWRKEVTRLEELIGTIQVTAAEERLRVRQTLDAMKAQLVLLSDRVKAVELNEALALNEVVVDGVKFPDPATQRPSTPPSEREQKKPQPDGDRTIQAANSLTEAMQTLVKESQQDSRKDRVWNPAPPAPARVAPLFDHAVSESDFNVLRVSVATLQYRVGELEKRTHVPAKPVLDEKKMEENVEQARKQTLVDMKRNAKDSIHAAVAGLDRKQDRDRFEQQFEGQLETAFTIDEISELVTSFTHRIEILIEVQEQRNHEAAQALDPP